LKIKVDETLIKPLTVLLKAKQEIFQQLQQMMFDSLNAD